MMDMSYTPDNDDAYEHYDVEMERGRKLRKRLSLLERMEEIDDDTIRIDRTV